MKHAKKLGLLGLTAVGLTAVFGLLGSGAGTIRAESFTPTGRCGSDAAGTPRLVQCSDSVDAAVTAGNTITLQIHCHTGGAACTVPADSSLTPTSQAIGSCPLTTSLPATGGGGQGGKDGKGFIALTYTCGDGQFVAPATTATATVQCLRCGGSFAPLEVTVVSTTAQ